MKVFLLKDNFISGMDSLIQLCVNHCSVTFRLSASILRDFVHHGNYAPTKISKHVTKTTPKPKQNGTCGPIKGPPQPSAMPAGKLCRGGSMNPQLEGCIYTWTKLILTDPIVFFGSYASNMMQAPKNCIDCAMFTCISTANRVRQCFMILGQFQNLKRTYSKSVIPFW